MLISILPPPSTSATGTVQELPPSFVVFLTDTTGTVIIGSASLGVITPGETFTFSRDGIFIRGTKV